MDLMIKTILTLLIVVSLLSIGILFLNYSAQRRANQLAVARRYGELSEVLSNELQIRSRIIDLFKRRKSKDRQELTGLAKTTVDDQEKRIKEIELLQEEIEEKFNYLDHANPIEIEKQVLTTLHNKRNAEIILKRFESTSE